MTVTPPLAVTTSKLRRRRKFCGGNPQNDVFTIIFGFSSTCQDTSEDPSLGFWFWTHNYPNFRDQDLNFFSTGTDSEGWAPAPPPFLFSVFSHPPTTSNTRGRPLNERSITHRPGTGVCGICAAPLGASRVLLTDDRLVLLSLARSNVWLNAALVYKDHGAVRWTCSHWCGGTRARQTLLAARSLTATLTQDAAIDSLRKRAPGELFHALPPFLLQEALRGDCEFLRLPVHDKPVLKGERTRCDHVRDAAAHAARDVHVQ